MAIILLSHLINVVVAGLLPALMLSRAPTPAMDAVYGADAPARRILACVYGAIAAMSAYAFIAWAWLDQSSAPLVIGLVLFPLQIVYKLATLAAVGPAHPVAQANAAIAGVHALSVWQILAANPPA